MSEHTTVISRPFWLLFWSAILTKVLATLAAVYGWFMVPIGWKWALLIWGYALVWFLLNDRIKLAATASSTRRNRFWPGEVKAQ